MGKTNGEVWAEMGITLHQPRREKKRARQARKRDYPGELLLSIQAMGWPEPVREHAFHPIRQWRLDLAWPDLLLAVECHGGIWEQGRHVRGAGFTEDREKMNSAAELGWQVIEVACPHQMGQALDWIEGALRKRGII